MSATWVWGGSAAFFMDTSAGGAVMKLYLGLDVGTSVVKASAFDASGATIATARERMPVSRSRPGWAEQDPVAVWRAVARCMRRLSTVTPAHEWRAIGVAAQGDGCWFVDGQLRPVGPAAVWLDGRAAPIVESWIADGTDRAYFRETANVPFPGAVPALLRWYELHDLQTLARARWLLSCADWVVACLTGTVTTDPVNASRGVTDTALAGWNCELAAALGLGDWSHLMPPMKPALSVRGAITARAARETSLPIGLLVMAASMDVYATMLGAGVAEPGDALTIIGTTALNTVVVEGPVFEPEMVGFNGPMPSRGWARSMAAMAGTINVDWVANMLGLRGSRPAERLVELAAEAAPGAGGVLFLPFIAPGGERAPFVRPSARAGFVGLDAGSDRAVLARATVEGVALAIRHCHSFLPESCAPLWVTGGGSRSRLWCQVVADMLGRRVVRVDVEEPGTLGMAMSAAVAMGDLPSMSGGIERWVRRGDAFDPVGAGGVYDELYALYVHAIQAHVPLWEERVSTAWPASTVEA